ncbi:MAG: hypothetical protein HYV07_13245 [Deltaproteobacteria bacterium]|nr:hypothetical protein [Deltaproteobacteria bacterium]
MSLGMETQLEIAEPLRTESAEEMAKWVAQLSGEGWLYSPGTKVHRFLPGRLEQRPILAAEVAVSEQESVCVRFDGRWFRAWRYTERSGGESCRRVTKLFVSTEPSSTQLMTYHVYFRNSTDHGFELEPGERPVSVLRPYASRFAGWRDS